MALKARLRALRLQQLSLIQVASPCSADWEEMEGDEKVRFCSGCQQHVYNLSAMDVEEAAERVVGDTDGLCIRFFRRPDGTVLTQDCPVGVDEKRLERRQALRTIAGTAAGVAAAGAMLFTPTMGAYARPAARPAVMASAIKGGDLRTVKQLLQTDVDVNHRWGSGETLLMLAAKYDNVDAARLLVCHGADLSRRTEEGRTALSIAREMGSRRVGAYLEKVGAVE